MEYHIHKDDSSGMITLLGSLAQGFPQLIAPILEVSEAAKHGITLEVRPYEPSRSRQQEKYYRKWAGEFGRFTGNTPDEIHEIMLGTCYGSDEVETKFGPVMRPRKRSAEASRMEYSELIETLIRVAGEMGFVVPPAQTPLQVTSYE